MIKKIFIFIVPAILLSAMLFACTAPNPETPATNFTPVKNIQSLEGYQTSIDYSCNSSQDCQVKNIGNCCGYYPACTNKNANANPELVNKLCQKESMAGVCGFSTIESCECINNKCQSKD